MFSFHRPGDADRLARRAPPPPAAPTLRHRLRALPQLRTTGSGPRSSRAIGNLERSLAANRPRALIQMATGSGKTFTAANVAYRLVKHADARRILFLVDRANLGRRGASIPNVRDGRSIRRNMIFATTDYLGECFVGRGDLLAIRTNGSRDLIGRVARVDRAAAMAFAS